MNKDSNSLWGYGWKRALTSEEVLSLKDHLPEGLNDFRRGAACAVLDDLAIGRLRLEVNRLGVGLCRDHLCPEMVGVGRIEIVIENGTFRTGEAARMLGLSDKKLRRLMQRVKNGQVDVVLPPRSVGRTASKRGWYIWSKSNIMAWRDALIEGKFNAWSRESVRRN